MADPTRTVSLKGGEEWLHAISVYSPERLAKVTTRSLERMAEDVQHRSRTGYLSGQVLQKRTGDLFDSITFSSKKPAEYQRLGSPLPQSMPLHFGWPGHNLPPRPYLFPAMDDRSQFFPDIVVDELEREEAAA